MLFSAMRPTEGGITSSRQRASLPAGGSITSDLDATNRHP